MITGFLIGTFLTLGLIFAGTGYVTFLVLKWGHRHPGKAIAFMARLPGFLGITIDTGSEEPKQIS